MYTVDIVVALVLIEGGGGGGGRDGRADYGADQHG